jgi:hypothetical protein
MMVNMGGLVQIYSYVSCIPAQLIIPHEAVI